MFFLLALRVSFTNETWDQYMGNESTVPAISMCFAQFCGHCRRALPGFQEFADSLADSPSVVVGTLNCTEYNAFCVQNLSIHAFPTFLVKTRLGVDTARIRARPEIYNQLLERVLQVQNNKLIVPWTGHPEKFPTILFRLNPNDDENLTVAERDAFRASIRLNTTFAVEFDESLQSPSAVAYVADDVSVTMEREFTQWWISSFADEHSHALFGDWSLQSIQTVSRHFVCIVTANDADADSFLPLAKEYYSKAQFGRTNPGFTQKDAFTTFGLSKRDLPAAVIVNVRHHAFSKLTHATVESTRELLDRVIDEDDSVPFEQFKEPWSLDLPREALYLVAIILIGVCAVSAITVFAILWYYRPRGKPAPKPAEQKKED